MEIFGSKRNLKGTGIGITENLTATRTTLFKAACDAFTKELTWTSEGRVFSLIDGKKTHIPRLSFLSNR